MKINSELLTNTKPKTVGRLSFDSFLKIADEFSDFSIDNLSLATINDRYKIYTCSIKKDKKDEFIKSLSRYESLELIKFWIDLAIPDNTEYLLYFSAYYTKAGWLMDYGVSSINDLYVVGRFNLNAATIATLTKAKVLKGFFNDFSNTDLRTHALLELIRKDLFDFDLGICRKTEPNINGLEITISTNGLGEWEHKQGAFRWKDGEAEKYLKKFQEWAAKKRWSKSIKLSIRPSVNYWVIFAIIIKFKSSESN